MEVEHLQEATFGQVSTIFQQNQHRNAKHEYDGDACDKISCRSRATGYTGLKFRVYSSVADEATFCVSHMRQRGRAACGIHRDATDRGSKELC